MQSTKITLHAILYIFKLKIEQWKYYIETRYRSNFFIYNYDVFHDSLA